MRISRILVSAVLLGLSAQAFAADVRFVCPCTVEANGSTAVSVTFGLINLDGAASGNLSFNLIGHDTPHLADGGQSPVLSVVNMDTTIAGNTTLASATYDMGFFTQGLDPAFITIQLLENGAPRDLIRMRQQSVLSGIPGGSAFDSNSDVALAIYMDGDPTFSLNGSQATINLPAIRNNAVSTATGELVLQVRRINSADFFQPAFVVGSQTLTASLAPRSEIAAQQLVLNLNLGGTSGSHYHLNISDAGTLRTWVAVSGPGIDPRVLSVSNIEILEDNDSDGVGNYAERLAGTDPDSAGSTPGASQINALVLYSQNAPAAASNDIDAYIDQEEAFTNQMFANSGVQATINVVAREQVTIDENRDIEALWDDMNNEVPPFDTLQADKQAAGADVAFLFLPFMAGSQFCGIATLGAAEQNGDFGSTQNFVGSNSVVYVDCDDFTTPHELGHLMGLAHSRVQVAAGDGDGTFPWALGHGVNTSFVTVMGYSTEFQNAPQASNFSSPNLTCSGLPCGVDSSDLASGADAVRALNVSRFQVERYVDGSAGGQDGAVVPADGGAVGADFAAASEDDFFSFFGQSGRTYTVETSALGAGVDTEVEVLKDATSLGQDDNGGAGNASRLVIVAASSGQFVIRVGNVGGTIGSYAISVTETLAETPDANVILVAAVLPTSRSVQIGASATAFLTVINAGSVQARGCSISPGTSLPVNFSFQRTDPNTNALLGDPFEAVDLNAGAAQSFVAVLTPSEAFDSTAMEFRYICDNSNPATPLTGINTLQLSSSATPIPDVIALAATVLGDGIVHIPGATGNSFFTLATSNVGSSGTLMVSADTGGAVLPITVAICQTNPTTGVCINPTAPTTGEVTVTINNGETPTFAIFVTGSDVVAANAAVNRIFVVFRDAGGVSRGSTSVAVQTD